MVFSINILMPFILIFYCLDYIRKISFNKYVIFALLVFMGFSYFIPLYSCYGIPYARVMNIIYFIFVICLVYTTCWLIQILDKKFFFSNILKYPFIRFFLLIFIFFNSIFYCSNIREAYLDLYTGKAMLYAQDRENMFNKIKNSKEDIVTVDEAIFSPKTVYFKDPYTKFPFIAEYFHKKDVIINWEKSITDKEDDLMSGRMLKRFVKTKIGFKSREGYKEKL